MQNVVDIKNKTKLNTWQNKMEISRLRCEQIPEVVFLGVGQGSSTVYLAHAHKFVGVLRGNMERSSASRAFSSFLNSMSGKVLKDNHGGDLLSSIQKGGGSTK